jgi:hypothetical protein
VTKKLSTDLSYLGQVASPAGRLADQHFAGRLFIPFGPQNQSHHTVNFKRDS